MKHGQDANYDEELYSTELFLSVSACNKKPEEFKLKKRCQVTKILIDPTTKTTNGVEFVQGKKNYVVCATKEVILSAGTVDSRI